MRAARRRQRLRAGRRRSGRPSVCTAETVSVTTEWRTRSAPGFGSCATTMPGAAELGRVDRFARSARAGSAATTASRCCQTDHVRDVDGRGALLAVVAREQPGGDEAADHEREQQQEPGPDQGPAAAARGGATSSSTTTSGGSPSSTTAVGGTPSSTTVVSSGGGPGSSKSHPPRPIRSAGTPNLFLRNSLQFAPKTPNARRRLLSGAGSLNGGFHGSQADRPRTRPRRRPRRHGRRGGCAGST